MVMIELNNNSTGSLDHVNNPLTEKKDDKLALLDNVEKDGFGDRDHDSGIKSNFESGQTDPQQSGFGNRKKKLSNKPNEVPPNYSIKAQAFDYEKEINNLKADHELNEDNLKKYEQDFVDAPIKSGVITNKNVHGAILNGNMQFRNKYCQNVLLFSVYEFFFIIKLIPMSKFVKRRQEVQVPLQLNSYPWMVKVFGLGKLKIDGIVYAVMFMEYFPVLSLDKTPLPWTLENVRRFLVGLLHVIQEMQILEIVHGDLKLENLCLRNLDQPESFAIIDWESAKNPKFEINFIGTPQYNPPWFSSIVRLARTNDENVHEYLKTLDLWAVGVLCCILITGKIPWYDKQLFPKQMIVYITNHPSEMVKYIPNIGGSLGDVIRGLLPASGRIEDQISAEEALCILEDRDPKVSTDSSHVETKLPVSKKKPLSLPKEQPTDEALHLPSESDFNTRYSVGSCVGERERNVDDDQTIPICLNLNFTKPDFDRTLKMKFRGKVFRFPFGMKFKEILNIPRIAAEIRRIRAEDDAYKDGCSTWKKIGGKLKFLHGSIICNDDFELEISPLRGMMHHPT